MLDSYKFQNIGSWWLKLALLLLTGMPLFSTLPSSAVAIGLKEYFGEALAEILSVATFTLIVWSVCLFSLGYRKFLEYLAGAFMMALTTVLLGALIRKLLPVSIFHDSQASSIRLLKLFYNILMVFPYSLMFINSFSAGNLIKRMTGARGHTRNLGLHLALTLRIFQHVGDVISRLLLIWKEEHPQLLLPRHRKDWAMLSIPFFYSRWLLQSIIQWIFACIILAFEPIPVMVEEIEQLYDNGEKDD